MPTDRLHAEWRDPTLIENGQHLLLEAHAVSGIKGVQRHLNGVEGKTGVEHGKMHIRVFVAGESDEAYFPLLLRFEQRLCGAAGTNEQLGIILKDDAVHLPQVEVVGLKTTQRLFEHLHGERSVAAVSAHLGHDEGFVALALETQAHPGSVLPR